MIILSGSKSVHIESNLFITCAPSQTQPNERQDRNDEERNLKQIATEFYAG